MITTDELKVQLADYGTAVKDLEEALAIDASRKRVQELEHTMSRPGFYDDAELSKKVFDEVGDLKGKLTRFEKLQGLYDDAETMLVMLDEEYDPDMVPEAEEAVNAVGKAVDELQLMTMLNGEYDHSNAILTFHAGTGGTEAQDWAEMLYRMYNKWAQAHGMTVEVLDYQDGDEAGMKSASMMVKGANAYGLLKSENGVHRLVRVSPFDANARRQTSFASLEVMPELDNTIQVDIRPEDIDIVPVEQGQLVGTVTNVTFKGMQYDIIVDFRGFKWLIQTTDHSPVGARIGVKIDPDGFHIMKKSEYSGQFGDYSSYSEEYEELADASLETDEEEIGDEE